MFQHDEHLQTSEEDDDKSCNAVSATAQSKELPETSSASTENVLSPVAENVEEASACSSEIYGNLPGAANASIILGTQFFDISW